MKKRFRKSSTTKNSVRDVTNRDIITYKIRAVLLIFIVTMFSSSL